MENRSPQEDRPNRREFLRKASGVGASSLAAAGLSEIATGSVRAATDREIKRAWGQKETRGVYTELSEPEVHLEQATRERTAIGSDVMTVTKIPTALGTIAVGEIDGRFASHFSIEEAESSKLPDHLTGAPSGTDAKLLGTQGGVVSGRLATETESDIIADKAEFDATDMVAFTTSEIDGFVVQGHRNGEPTRKRVIGPGGVFNDDDDCITASSVSTTGCGGGGGGGDGSGTPCDNRDWCYSCYRSFAACSGCAVACYAAVGVPPTIVACGICLYITCSYTTFECTLCYECNN